MASSIHQNINGRSKNLSIHFSHGDLSIHLSIRFSHIISSIAGLSLKYNNQMVRNSKHAIACYENKISTSGNLKNLFFSSINFNVNKQIDQ